MAQPLGALSGAAGGVSDAIAGLIEQRLKQAQLAETVRSHQAEEKYRQDALTESAAYRKDAFHSQQADRDMTAAEKLGGSLQLGDELAPKTAGFLSGNGQASNVGAGWAPDLQSSAAPPADTSADQGLLDATGQYVEPDQPGTGHSLGTLGVPDSIAAPPDPFAPKPPMFANGPQRLNAPAADSAPPRQTFKWLGDPKQRQAAATEDARRAYVASLPADSPYRAPAEFEQAMGRAAPTLRAAPANADIGPDVKTTMGGRKYVDLSTYGVAERAAVRDAAKKAGAATVGKEEASTLADVDLVRMNQKSLLDQIEGSLSADASGRFTTGLGNKIEQVLQTNGTLGAYGSWRATAIQTLRAMAGSKGLRINQAEIELALKNDIPNLTDTVEVAQQKVNNILTVMQHTEDSILVHDRSTLPGGSVGSAPLPASKGFGGPLPPKAERIDGMEYDTPGGRLMWSAADGHLTEAPKPAGGAAPRPSAADVAPAASAPAPAASAPAAPSVAPLAPVAPVQPPPAPGRPLPLDTNRLPEAGQLPAGSAGRQPPGPSGPLDTNRLPEGAPLPAGGAGRLQTLAPASQRRLSPAMLDTLKGPREGGFYATPYDDSGTGLAIGYGMQSWQGHKITPDMRVTQEQADQEMDRQLRTYYEPLVKRALKVPVSQPQYDQLVSVAWNSPRAALDLISKFNRGVLTPADFQKSATVKGVPNKGLRERRTEEAAPFVGGQP